MASEKTSNIGLNKWVPSDYVKVDEFNDNFDKIDEVAADHAAQLAEISKLELVSDIDNTDYKANQKYDTEYLRDIQLQKYAFVMRKLRTGLSVKFTFKGDSLTYGQDTVSSDKRPPDSTPIDDGSVHPNTRASTTYPEATVQFLNSVYPNKITMLNQGYEGDNAKFCYDRWFKKHDGDITIIMLGTNDSRNNSCPYVGDVEQFLYWMEQLIVRELIWGKAVVLLTPPKNRFDNDLNIDTFSNSLYLLGEKFGIPVVDTQYFTANYSHSIFADDTHYNGNGYTIFGSRVASLFIGDGLNSIKNVNSGSILLTRSMVDNIHYVNGCELTDSTSPNVPTPDEINTGSGIMLHMTDGGKAVYSFYCDTENLILLPYSYSTANVDGQTTMKFTLDFGVEQPENSIDTALLNDPSMPDTNKALTTFINGTPGIYYNKKYYLDNNIDLIRIVNKGWHTLTIDISGGTGNLFGIEFLGQQEWYSLRNAGRIKENILYDGGSVSNGIVTLKDSISKYKYIVICTGSVTAGNYTSSLLRSFNGNFVDDTKIVAQTVNGLFIATVDSDKQITITTANDPLRRIYGLNDVVY